MVIGPGEHERYLPQVLERISWWADDVFCALDLPTGTKERKIAEQWTSNVKDIPYTFLDHEGRFRQAAWWMMEEQLAPDTDDLIVCIDADELIVDHASVRRVAKEYPGQRIGWLFHHMWNSTHYRVDSLWKPSIAWIAIPYRASGSFVDRPLASGREPTYALQIPRVEQAAGPLLHYGYAMEKDQKMKHERYRRLDGGKYHQKAHLDSIIRKPVLEEWKGGGELHVPE